MGVPREAARHLVQQLCAVELCDLLKNRELLALESLRLQASRLCHMLDLSPSCPNNGLAHNMFVGTTNNLRMDDCRVSSLFIQCILVEFSVSLDRR